MAAKPGKILKVIARILLIMVLSVGGILIIVTLLLLIPAFQNRLAQFALTKIETRVNTKVTLESIRIFLPNQVTLKNFYAEDFNGDTLISAGKLKVNIKLLELLNKKIRLRNIVLENAVVKLELFQKDSLFNFNPYIEAFSTDKPEIKEPVDTTGRGYIFSINRIELKDVKFSYHDHIGNNTYQASIGEFELRLQSMDLQENNFQLNTAVLSESSAHIVINSVAELDEEPEKVAFNIGLQRKIEMNGVDFTMVNNVAQTELTTKNVNFSATSNEFDFSRNVLDLKRVSLSGTSIAYLIKKRAPDKPPEENDLKENGMQLSIPWQISLNELILKDNEIFWADENQPSGGAGMDFSNLLISNISAVVKNTRIHSNLIETNIEKFSLKEKSGFEIGQLSVLVLLTDTTTQLNNLLLITPHSRLQNSTVLSYTSLNQLQKNPYDVNFDTDISNSHIAVADLLYFQPSIASLNPIFSNPDRKILFDTHVTGTAGNMTIDYFRTGFDSTLLATSGNIRGLPNMDQAYFDISLDTFRTSRSDISMILPDTLLPEQFNLPPALHLTGNFEGTTDLFSTKLNLLSDYGNISANAEMKNDTLSDKRRVIAGIDVNSFELGKILASDTIGAVTLTANMTGTLPRDTFALSDANISANIKEIQLFGYMYENLIMEGLYANQTFEGTAEIADSNLEFKLSTDVDLSDSLPEFIVRLNLLGADFKALNLTLDEISARGVFNANLSGNNLNNLNGFVRFNKLLLIKDGEEYRLDSIFASVENTAETVNFLLKSETIEADYKGTAKLGELGQTLTSYIDQYFSLSDTLKPIDENQQFEFNVRVFNSNLIYKLFWPKLEDFQPGHISGAFDASKNDLQVIANFPNIKYDGFWVDSLLLDIHSSDTNFLSYSLSFRQFGLEPYIIGRTLLEGSADSNNVNFALQIMDDKEKEKFIIGGYMANEDQFTIHIAPDSLILNYNQFSIPENNLIVIGDQILNISNFQMQSGSQKIMVTEAGQNESLQRAFKIGFENFALSNIFGLIEAESNILNGTLDGSIILGNSETGKEFIADITVNDLEIFDSIMFSKIILAADNRNKDVLEINSRFTGYENNMTLTGTINTAAETSMLDLNLDIQNLNLARFSPVVRSRVNELSGRLTGEISVEGLANKPEINGQLNFINTQLLPKFLGTTIRIPDETIEIRGDKLLLNKFAILDNNGKEAILDGSVSFEQINEPIFDIRLRSADFQFLNTTSEDNDLFYGTLIAGINANITGTTASPRVNIEVELGEESDLYFVVPGLTSETIEREGIIRFIVKEDDDIWSQILERNLENENTTSGVRNLNLFANIEIREGMELHIIIDPVSNEELYIQGNGNLSMSMQGAGSPSLTGRFEISDGTYSLKLFEVLKREFTIRKGSYLQWNGEIMNAFANITAVYEVRTSPMPLIANQTVNLSAEAAAQYSEVQVFYVGLNISDNLTQPKINFDLSVPVGSAGQLVQSSLNRLNENEGQLNKQVFSLLLFNSFIASTGESNQPLAYELTATARTSISRLLTRQLNSFTERHIRGFDINVDIDSYYRTPGQEATATTDVSLGVTKRLFNERLTVKVGGDINVEGPEEQSKYGFNSIAGDMVVEYKLNRDGNYILQGFKKTEYEDIIVGEITKTGISFIFNKEFFYLRKR